MNNDVIFSSLTGGALIGLSAVILMLGNGRIAGISGIINGLISQRFNQQQLWRIAFILGLISGPLLYGLLGGQLPQITITPHLPYLIIGGLLVGFGSTLGSGCTSGHGVCGLSRISPRSIAATVVFLLTAVLTVWLTR